MKNILVMGSGAVGGFYGAHLAQVSTLDVTFVARGAHLEALQKTGLQITGKKELLLKQITAVSLPSEVTVSPDLVIISVKSFHTNEAIELLRPVITKNTIILTLQNGLENYERLAEAFGSDNVIRGFCKIGVEVTAPGVIDYRGLSKVFFGEENGLRSNRVLQLQKIFQLAGIEGEVSENIHKEAWLKFIWNGIFNMITGLAKVTLDQVFLDKHAHATAWQLFYEMQAVAGVCGVTVSEQEGAEIINGAEELGVFRTSTYQDRQKGKPLEYDAFCGYVVRKAEEYDIGVPVNRTILALYQLLDQSDRNSS